MTGHRLYEAYDGSSCIFKILKAVRYVFENFRKMVFRINIFINCKKKIWPKKIFVEKNLCGNITHRKKIND